jgi:trigger factor
MKIEVKNIPNSQKELSVELPVESYEKAFEEEYNKIAPTIQLKGFRKGKAPKKEILKHYKNKINVNALESLINSSVFESLQKEGINPLNQPQVKDVNFEEGEPITFKVIVDVYPEFEITKYKDFEFDKEIEKLDEEDVEKALSQLSEKNTSLEPAEEGYAIQKGDLAVIDFEGKIDGKPFDGGTAQGYQIVVGTNTFIEGFEDGLIGMKAGETKDIEVTFPEDYHEKKYAGKKAVFTVTLQEIKKHNVPELNDDFAKEVDEDCETLEDLKQKLRDDLTEELEHMAKDRLFDKMLTKFIEENPFDIPDSMITDQANRLAEQTLKQYQYMYGLTPEQLGMSLEKVAESMRDRAEMQVKSALILNKIAELEKIDVEDDDVNEKIKEYAKKMKRDFEEYKKELETQGAINNIKNNVITDKIYKFLIENNKVNEIYLTKEEMEEKFKQESENNNEDK